MTFAKIQVHILNMLQRYQLTKDYTEKQIQHLIDIFVACSRYELVFWQMSWDKSC